jgi:endonuclease/exonuclease/phosphatase family metal-dependent hydrolase
MSASILPLWLGFRYPAVGASRGIAALRLLLGLPLGLAALGCSGPAFSSGNGSGSADTLRIATFNIQVFGQSKANKPDVMRQLVDLIRQYDVVAIQEIKDASGETPQRLLDAINDTGGDFYDLLLSPRTGVQPDDLSSQEQYAVVYRKSTLSALPGDTLFDDSASDLFQREPYITHLKARQGNFSFALIDIHTRPQSAVAEIDALHEVVQWAQGAYPGEDDFIVLGDYNAGCDYASPTQLDELEFRGPAYFWIVPDDNDSTVSLRTACAYDRIVTTASTQSEFTGNWDVDRAFTDSSVSDHWPVWAEFTTTER